MKAFILWLLMSEDRHGASKYNAKVIMKGDGGTIIMDGLLISSVESIPTIDKCEEENGKYFWCIPLTVAKNICKQKDEAGIFTSRRIKVRVEYKDDK